MFSGGDPERVAASMCLTASPVWPWLAWMPRERIAPSTASVARPEDPTRDRHGHGHVQDTPRSVDYGRRTACTLGRIWVKYTMAKITPMRSKASVKKTINMSHIFLDEPAALNASAGVDAASTMAQIDMARAATAIRVRRAYAATLKGYARLSGNADSAVPGLTLAVELDPDRDRHVVRSPLAYPGETARLAPLGSADARRPRRATRLDCGDAEPAKEPCRAKTV